jgi:hypothetical protein
MLQVQVSSAQQVRVLSLQQFLGAQVCPTAMFVEEAIVRFNSRAHAEGAEERATLIRVPVTIH